MSLFGQGWLGFSAMDISFLLFFARAFVHSTGTYVVELVEALSLCLVNNFKSSDNFEVKIFQGWS